MGEDRIPAITLIRKGATIEIVVMDSGSVIVLTNDESKRSMSLIVQKSMLSVGLISCANDTQAYSTILGLDDEYGPYIQLEDPIKREKTFITTTGFEKEKERERTEVAMKL